MSEFHMTIPVQQTVDFSREDLTDILSLIDEGGINYWGEISGAEGYEAAKEKLLQAGQTQLCYEDVLAEVLISGGKVEVYDNEEDTTLFFGIAELEKALSEAAKVFGTDLCQWDGITGDFIGQMACFGEVIYG